MNAALHGLGGLAMVVLFMVALAPIMKFVLRATITLLPEDDGPPLSAEERAIADFDKRQY